MKKINKLIMTLIFIFYPQFLHAEGLGEITDKIRELSDDIFGITDAVRILGLAILALFLVIYICYEPLRNKVSRNMSTFGYIFVLWVVMMYFSENIQNAVTGAFSFQKFIRK